MPSQKSNAKVKQRRGAFVDDPELVPVGEFGIRFRFFQDLVDAVRVVVYEAPVDAVQLADNGFGFFIGLVYLFSEDRVRAVAEEAAEAVDLIVQFVL